MKKLKIFFIAIRICIMLYYNILKAKIKEILKC